jgi:hypothetical protein
MRRENKREGLQEVTIFCNKTSEVMYHHDCYTLFIKSKSLGPDYNQEAIAQEHEYQEAKII